MTKTLKSGLVLLGEMAKNHKRYIVVEEGGDLVYDSYDDYRKASLEAYKLTAGLLSCADSIVEFADVDVGVLIHDAVTGQVHRVTANFEMKKES